MKHLPNIITCARLCLVPVFCYFLWNGNSVVAGIVFVIAALSDVLDGFLARRLNATSNFGKLADPFADKIMQISAIVLLFLISGLRPWIMITLFVKDFILMLGGLLFQVIYKITVSARWYGKVAALILNAILAVVILFGLSASKSNLLNILMTFAMTLQIAALIGYTVLGIRKLKRAKSEIKET